MSSFVLDIEADNLYPFQKNVWVVCLKKVGTDLRLKVHPYKDPKAKEKIVDFVFQDEEIPTIVGHNYLGFDGFVLWYSLGIPMSVGRDTFAGRGVRYFDTLFGSQFFLPDRDGHSLEDWGKRLGDHKIEYRKLLVEKGLLDKDAPKFAEFSFWCPDMDIYCEKDVDVDEKVYVQLEAQLKEEGSEQAFRLGQKTFFLMAAQSFTGFKFDIDKANVLKFRIECMIDELRREVEPELPPRKLKKTEEPEFRIPAKPYTKNGEFSALMNRFIDRVGAKVVSKTAIEVNGRTIPIVGHGLVQDTVPMLLDDQNALKDYFLNELKWVPTLWNYKKDAKGKPIRDEKGKLIQTSPKMQEAGKICENLLALDGELPKKITRFMSLRNRLSILTGWLEHPRLQWDGRLPAGSSGIAATHRQRHTIIVNVPKAQEDVLLGKEFRELFTVEEGNKLVGCDQSALEARCEAHWVYDFPGGLERVDILLSRDIHNHNCKIFFPIETKNFDINSPDFSKDHPGFKPYRSLSKNGGYALAYGCTPKKLASTLRKNEKEGPALYDAYWAANPSLKAFKDKLEYVWEKEGGKKWIPGLDGRRLHSRSKHSLVNLQFQSTGAIIVDYSLCMFDMKMGGLKLDSRGRPYYQYKGKTVKRVGYWHDEAVTETDPSVEKEVAQLMEQCMVEAGVRLNLNIPLAAESKIGFNWAETH